MAYRGRGRAVRGAYRRCPGGLGKGGERPRTGGSCRGFERWQASSASMQIVCLKCGRNLVALLQEAGLYEYSGFLSLSFYSIDRGVREEGELARGAFPECVGCCFFRASVPTEECVPGWHRAGRMAWARGRIAKPTGQGRPMFCSRGGMVEGQTGFRFRTDGRRTGAAGPVFRRHLAGAGKEKTLHIVDT